MLLNLRSFYLSIYITLLLITLFTLTRTTTHATTITTKPKRIHRNQWFKNSTIHPTEETPASTMTSQSISPPTDTDTIFYPTDSRFDFRTVNLKFGDSSFILDDWYSFEHDQGEITQVAVAYKTDQTTPKLLDECYYTFLMADRPNKETGDAAQFKKLISGRAYLQSSWRAGYIEITINLTEAMNKLSVVRMRIECQLDPNSWTDSIGTTVDGEFRVDYEEHWGGGSATWNYDSHIFKTPKLLPPPHLKNIPNTSFYPVQRQPKSTAFLAFGFSTLIMADLYKMKDKGAFSFRSHSNYVLAIASDADLNPDGVSNYCNFNGVEINRDQFQLYVLSDGSSDFDCVVFVKPTKLQMNAISSFGGGVGGNGLSPLSINCNLIQFQAPSGVWADQIKTESIPFDLIFYDTNEPFLALPFDSVLIEAFPSVSRNFPVLETNAMVQLDNEKKFHLFTNFDFERYPATQKQQYMSTFDFSNSKSSLSYHVYNCMLPSGDDGFEEKQYRNNGAILNNTLYNVPIPTKSSTHTYDSVSLFTSNTLLIQSLTERHTSQLFDPSTFRVHTTIPCQPELMADNIIPIIVTFSTQIDPIFVDTTHPVNSITSSWYQVIPFNLDRGITKGAISVQLDGLMVSTQGQRNDITQASTTTNSSESPLHSLDDLDLSTLHNDYSNYFIKDENIDTGLVLSFNELLWPKSTKTPPDVDQVHIKLSFSFKSFTFNGDFSTCRVLFPSGTRQLDPIELAEHIYQIFPMGDVHFNGTTPSQKPIIGNSTNIPMFKFILSRLDWYTGHGFDSEQPSFRIHCSGVAMVPVPGIFEKGDKIKTQIDTQSTSHVAPNINDHLRSQGSNIITQDYFSTVPSKLNNMTDYLTISTWINHNDASLYTTTLHSSIVQLNVPFPEDPEDDSKKHNNNRNKLIIGLSVGGTFALIVGSYFIYRGVKRFQIANRHRYQAF